MVKYKCTLTFTLGMHMLHRSTFRIYDDQKLAEYHVIYAVNI